MLSQKNLESVEFCYSEGLVEIELHYHSLAPRLNEASILPMEQDTFAGHCPKHAARLTIHVLVFDQPGFENDSHHSPAAESALPAIE